MQQVLPIIIVCCVGLSICFGLLVFYFVRFIVRHFKHKREEFELDENTLTINLDKKRRKQ